MLLLRIFLKLSLQANKAKALQRLTMERVEEVVMRRKKHIFTEDQRCVLRRAYREDKHPDLMQRLELAEELNATEEQVKIWFQNRRNVNVSLKSETPNLTTNGSGMRERCRFSDAQRRTLEQAYEESTRPDLMNRQKLAEQLGVTETQIRVWFQNKRSGNHVSRESKADQTVVASLHDGLVKPKRHTFSDQQRGVLEKFYAENTNPDFMTRQVLAEGFGLTENQIRIWFQNRRSVQNKSESTVTNSNQSASASTPIISENVNTAAIPDKGARMGNIIDVSKEQQSTRNRFSKDQLRYLYTEFEKGDLPNMVRRSEISCNLGVPEPSVKIWFQNMRRALIIRNMTFQEFLNSKNVKENYTEITSTEVRREREESNQENVIPAELVDQSVSTGTVIIDENVNTTAKPDKDTSMGNTTDVSNVRGKEQQNTRYKFSKDQLRYLYTEFEKDDLPNMVRRSEISCNLDVPEPSVKIWFQNMRRALKIKNITFQEFLNIKNMKENHTEITSTDVKKESEDTNQEILIQGELVGSYVAGSEALGEILEALKLGKVDYDYTSGFHPDKHPDVLYDCYINPQEQQREEASNGNNQGVSELNPQVLQPVSMHLNSAGSKIQSIGVPEFHPKQLAPVSNVDYYGGLQSHHVSHGNTANAQEFNPTVLEPVSNKDYYIDQRNRYWQHGSHRNTGRSTGVPQGLEPASNVDYHGDLRRHYWHHGYAPSNYTQQVEYLPQVKRRRLQ